MKSSKQKQKKSFQNKNAESYTQPFFITHLKESLNKDHNTAVGPDKIHYQFLKELPEISKNYCLQIFNNIWDSNDIPKIWKQTSYSNTKTYEKQRKCKKIQTHYS